MVASVVCASERQMVCVYKKNRQIWHEQARRAPEDMCKVPEIRNKNVKK